MSLMVEHIFVTTSDGPAALATARELFERLGFREERARDGAVEFHRGVRDPRYTKSLDKSPQQVRLDYDRGRVTFAARIEFTRKPKPLHRDLLRALAEIAEACIGQHRPLQEARTAWDSVAARVAGDTARRRRNKRIIAAVVIALFAVALIALI